MGKVSVFNFITLNGFYKGIDGDVSWRRHGSEEGEFAKENLKKENIMLFGRITYEQMKSYWPTPAAKAQNPVMAEGMNNATKIIFSKTLKKAEWENARIASEELVTTVKKLKQTESKDMIILGSGSISCQLAEAGLIDQFEFMIEPVALGGGTFIFDGIRKKLDLELIGSRTFNSGVVLLTYKPLEK